MDGALQDLRRPVRRAGLLITEGHSYDTPEIIATPVVAGSMDYLAWITEQTEPGERDEAVDDLIED